MSALRIVGGVSGFVLSLGYCAARIAVGNRRDLAHDVARVMSRLTLGGARIHVVVRNEHLLDLSRPCVFVANHQSYLDLPIMATALPRGTAVVAKSEIARIPVVGRLFRLAGQPVIDREDAAKASATLASLGDSIRREGLSVAMFPEGTFNRVMGTLRPFKSGAFRLAVAAGVPIVPVVLSQLRPLFDLERGVLAGRQVTLSILTPEAAGADPAGLRDRVRERMLAALRAIETS